MKRRVQLFVMTTFRKIFWYADEIFSYFSNACVASELRLNTTQSENMASVLRERIIMSSCLGLMVAIAVLSKSLGLLEWSILGVLSLRRFDTSPAM